MALRKLKSWFRRDRTEAPGEAGKPPVLKLLSGFVGACLFVTLVLGIYWSGEPDAFSVSGVSRQIASERQLDIVVGTVTTATVIHITETLLEKPGGYLSNDIAPPGLWLDNMPSWEYGVLIQLRDFAKSMRENFSRSQSQSVEDRDLVVAEPALNFPNNSWIFPASETQYAQAGDALTAYLERLSDPNNSDAQFFARADNLNSWLVNVETRLGSLSQRLSSSVEQNRINTDLAGETSSSQSTPAAREVSVKTPWLEIDNVFYEARGAAWALMHLLRAVQVDFNDVLEDKNAAVSLEQIIRELEATQRFVFSPMILNGSGFGLMANHSLVMASYLSRANAAIIDLRSLLAQG